jgi:hypothetical protein
MAYPVAGLTAFVMLTIGAAGLMLSLTPDKTSKTGLLEKLQNEL